jgi:hypothetical protein
VLLKRRTNNVSNAQEKAARDRRWMISGARMDGREEGRREGIELGRLISVVQYQQSILGLPESTLSELCNLSAKDLNELAEHLLATIRSRT